MNMPLVLLNRRRRGSVGYNPAGLFSLNEPGIWLDPSDVANLDWRRNLLTYTEQFDNAVWGKGGTATIAAGTYGQIFRCGATAASQLTSGSFSVASGATAVQSIFARSEVSNFVVLTHVDLTSGAFQRTWFNLLTGQVGSTTSGGATVTSPVASISGPDANGRYRCTLAATFTNATTTRFALNISNSNNAFDGDALSGVYIYGAQLELGSVATDYQRISDVNTEVLERFPNTTMYQDRAGSTAVTTPGQSVGLRLDKSKGLVLGSEAGSISSGWTGYGTTPATVAYSSGVTITNNGTTGGGSFAFTTVVGRSYRLAITVANGSGLSERLRVGNSVGGLDLYNQLIGGATTIYVTATATTTYVNIAQTSANLGAVTTVSSFSVKELPGNHAVANSDAARGIYGIEPVGGRRNLLTFTEQFDNAAWTKTRATVTTNAAAAPDGTITADKLAETADTGTHNVANAAVVYAAGTYTVSSYVKAVERSWVFLVGLSNNDFNCFFNLSGSGSVGTAATGTTGSISDVGDGWFRVSVTKTFAASTVSGSTTILTSTGDGVSSYAGTAGSGVLIWGAQLETGSTATAYQRVTTQYDVTEAGKQTLHYVQYDGSDDGYVTPTITPGIDKVQVFAGVRKLSDAATGMIVESSTDAGSNNGAFRLLVPGNAGYEYRQRGSINAAGAAVSSGYASPITNVLTGIGDIAVDNSTLRINGTQAAQSTADQGTGNFLAYPLYIGRRGGTTLPFNGRDYGICVRFGANLDASTISATEAWLAQKTGVTI